MSHPYADRPDLPPIPETLDEAVDMIIATIPDDQKAAFAAGSDDLRHFHHGWGTGLRNDWGLWFGLTPISRYLREHGLFHGDDQSGVIMEAVMARLKGEPFDLAAKAAWYREWWAKRGQNPDGSPLAGEEPAGDGI